MLSVLNNDKRGVVLIVILAVLFLMCLIGITLVTTTRIEIKAATSFAAGAQARLVCDSALQIVLRDFTNDVTAYDKYGDGWYHYAQDDRGNLCFGGTVGNISGDTLVDESSKFEPTFAGDLHPRYEYLSGLLLQPNVNKDKTVLILRCNANTLTTSSDLTGIAYPGDEYRILGGYKLSKRNHSSVWPIGQVTNNDSGGTAGILDAQWAKDCDYWFYYNGGGATGWDVWRAHGDDVAAAGDNVGEYGPNAGKDVIIFDVDEFGGGYHGQFYGGSTGGGAVSPLVCPEGFYTTDERFDTDPGSGVIFEVPADQVWVFNTGSGGTWMWVDQEVDLTGDGTDESKWINFDLYDARYSSKYTAYVCNDTAGQLNVNMAGNLAKSAGTEHYENMGFDSFELNLVRFIEGVAAEGWEIDNATAISYAQGMIAGIGGVNGRAQTNPRGYGLIEVPADIIIAGSASGTIDDVTSVWRNGTEYFLCEVSWGGTPDMNSGTEPVVPFFGRCNWRLRASTVRIIGNTANTILTTSNPGTGAFTIGRSDNLGDIGYDPGDSANSSGWSPFDELDEMEIRKNSPYASRLEKCIVDAGHDTRDNNGNSADTDDGGTGATDYHELRWGYDPNDVGVDDASVTAKANAGRDEDGRYMDGTGTTVMDELDDDGDGNVDEADEVYSLHEEWDMIRHHLTTRFPSAVSFGQKYQPGSTTNRSSNTPGHSTTD